MADDDQPELSTFGGGGDTDSDGSGEGDATADSDGGEDRDGAVGQHNGECDAGDDVDALSRSPVAELDRSARVELGVDLLAHVEVESLSLSEAVDRIETVTTDPALTREILDTAELRGVIDREGGRLLTRRGGTFVRFDRQVVRREGDYQCRRCGASLSTGHFVRFESGELGPFGPSCVRRVLGRE
ncbi:DUF5830 family protein [Halobellus sp. GM3]|uniref:DUF5830 family protein n=1 Tax=Halobellus sp. GM3 TaxID=3458410 RepID=UPI00403E251D